MTNILQYIKIGKKAVCFPLYGTISDFDEHGDYTTNGMCFTPYDIKRNIKKLLHIVTNEFNSTVKYDNTELYRWVIDKPLSTYTEYVYDLFLECISENENESVLQRILDVNDFDSIDNVL